MELPLNTLDMSTDKLTTQSLLKRQKLDNDRCESATFVSSGYDSSVSFKMDSSNPEGAFTAIASTGTNAQKSAVNDSLKSASMDINGQPTDSSLNGATLSDPKDDTTSSASSSNQILFDRRSVPTNSSSMIIEIPEASSVLVVSTRTASETSLLNNLSASERCKTVSTSGPNAVPESIEADTFVSEANLKEIPAKSIADAQSLSSKGTLDPENDAVSENSNVPSKHTEPTFPPESVINENSETQGDGGTAVTFVGLRSPPVADTVDVTKGSIMLRSSPVISAGDVTTLPNVLYHAKQVLLPGKGVLCGGATRAKRVKRKRGISWAPDSSLVDVRFIDTRLNLVKSWDPNFEVTLPFAPCTLETFKTLLKCEEIASFHSEYNEDVSDNKGNCHPSNGNTDADIPSHDGALSNVSSFEKARKREYNMEQDRVKRAKETLRNRLDAMVATITWVRPKSIMLPVECRVEENISRINILDGQLLTGNAKFHKKTEDSVLCANEVQWPASPPRDAWVWAEDVETSDEYVQNFPISDNADIGDIGCRVANGANEDSINGMRIPGCVKDFEKYSGTNADESSCSYDSTANQHCDRGRSAKRTDPLSNLKTRHDVQSLESLNGMSQNKAEYDVAKSGRRNQIGHPLAANVQQLLSALQSSGVLSGLKSDGFLAEGSRGENEALNGAMEHTTQCDSPTGYMIGNYNPLVQDVGLKENGYTDGRTITFDVGQGIGSNSGSSATGTSGSGMIAPPGFASVMSQSGMLECMPFGMGPVPMNAMGMPPPGLMEMGMGLSMGLGMMGMPVVPIMLGGGNGPIPTGFGEQVISGGDSNRIPALEAEHGDGNSGRSKNSSRSGKAGRNGRHVETISRPKLKPLKQRKKCKYFGTKQGCRDGDACMFAHN